MFDTNLSFSFSGPQVQMGELILLLFMTYYHHFFHEIHFIGNVGENLQFISAFCMCVLNTHLCILPIYAHTYTYVCVFVCNEMQGYCS